MGDPWTSDKLVLVLAFFIPGFIATQIWSLFVASDDRDIAKRFPTVVGYSAIHYALTGWLILVAPVGPAQTAAAYAVVFVLPILWTPVILLAREWTKWSKVFGSIKKIAQAMVTPEETPWDRVFTGRARFVRAKLKSGSYVGGYMGVGSEASTFPCDRQLFVSQAWKIDVGGDFVEKIARTGVMIQGDDVETIETIELTESDLEEPS